MGVIVLVKGADVLIVGGGVHGCASAYELAKEGVNVVLFEAEYLSYGGTGRSAAGIRHQFGTEVNCRLAIYNVQKFKVLQEELKSEFDLEFTQSGYLWIAYSDSQMNQLKKNVELQNSLGIKSEILSPQEIKKRWPYLSTEGIKGASFCSEDGHINPHTLNFAYAEAAKRYGAKILKYMPVEKLVEKDGKFVGLYTKDGTFYEGKSCLVAAGPWSVKLFETVGIDIPVTPERHQILVTEPIEYIGCPMVLCLDDGTYFKQAPNGTFLIGWGNPHEIKEINNDSTTTFLEEVAKRVLVKMPMLKGVRVVRQWAGPYDLTPDFQAILGRMPVDGLFINCGWSGHGLQFAPSASRVIKEMILGKEPFLDVSRFRYERFEENDLFFEPACI